MASRKIEVQLVGDSRSLERALGRATAGTSRFGSLLGGALRTGAYAATGGILALGYGLTKAVSSAADFQQQLNVLQATSGATGDQMTRISALSIRLGKDIKLPATSAQDAAVAMTELAKAGISVKDSMAAARSALQLATAGELDVSTAAQIMGTSLNQFSLKGSQATKVADLLAGAANASAGDVVDFAEGLKYAGTSAHAAGQSITMTVAALAEMANKGLQGSIAGSSLAQALRSLQAPSAKAAAEIKKLGLNIYDAHGNMKPLDEIAQVFTTHLGDMTQKQQNATLATIFGSRAVQAARIVFLGGKDALDKYAETVGKAGNAQRLTEARTKGFRGALAALKSNVETLGISIGLKLIPVATAAARELSKVVDVIGKMASAKSPKIAIQIAWKGVGRLYTSLQELLFGGIHDAQSHLGGKASGMNAIAVPLRYDGIVQNLIKALQAGFAAAPWGAIGKRVASSFASALKFTTDQASALVASLVKGINDNKAQIGTAAAAIALEMISALLDPGFWKDNWLTIVSIAIAFIPIGKFGAIGEKIGVALLRPVVDLAARFFPDTVLFIETLFRTGFRRIGGDILNYLRGTATRFPTFFNRAWNAIERSAIRIFRGIASTVGGYIKDLFSDSEKQGVRAFEGVGRAIIRAAGKLAGFFLKVGVIKTAIEGLVSAFNAVRDAIQYVIDKVEALGKKIGSLPSLPSLPKVPGWLNPTATGGIVTSPQLRTVGEAGPEAIIPLTGARGRQAIAGLGSEATVIQNFYGFDNATIKLAAKKLNDELARLNARRA